MSMTDPIADLLARVRNAILAKHDRLEVRASKMNQEICRILKEEGYIEDFQRIAGQPYDRLRVFLRYDGSGHSAITHLARVSRPGRRVYRGTAELKEIRNGLGTGIVSTSRGLLTDRQAREQRLGGEVLCEIW
jgi:small subunit ribosomal protein S8